MLRAESPDMEFTKRLRDRVRSGEITCSIRIWTRPHVKPGGRYRLGEGQIEIDSIIAIDLADITPKLARESGFDGVVDLLKTAKHGRGQSVYLVRFHYVRPRGDKRPTRAAKPSADRQRKRILRILERLPEATAVERGSHLSLEVRRKRFGYFLDDHHGDGRVAVTCKSSPDVREALQELAPAQIHVPKYVGNKGWIALWLDTPGVDWPAVNLALREAYALVAPKSLARPPRATHRRSVAPRANRPTSFRGAIERFRPRR